MGFVTEKLGGLCAQFCPVIIIIIREILVLPWNILFPMLSLLAEIYEKLKNLVSHISFFLIYLNQVLLLVDWIILALKKIFGLNVFFFTKKFLQIMSLIFCIYIFCHLTILFIIFVIEFLKFCKSCHSIFKNWQIL